METLRRRVAVEFPMEAGDPAHSASTKPAKMRQIAVLGAMGMLPDPKLRRLHDMRIFPRHWCNAARCVTI
jgi:hypothetical protein